MDELGGEQTQGESRPQGEGKLDGSTSAESVGQIPSLEPSNEAQSHTLLGRQLADLEQRLVQQAYTPKETSTAGAGSTESMAPLSTQSGHRHDQAFPLTPTNDAETALAGRYRLMKRLGAGSFGEVWQAEDPYLGRLVAVKRGKTDRRGFSIERFLAEGKRLAQLDHPGIVRVYDVGIEQNACYIVTELVEGNLEQHLRQPVSWREAVDFSIQIAEAAHAAHLRGFVHRDIKPANILVDSDGRCRLVDFGLATTETEQLRERSGVLGTFAYMSPEQLAGQSHLVDARADIYSIGVVLYRMLTGRLPFKAEDVQQYRELVATKEPRPVRTIVDSVPARVEAICLQCLARESSQRPTTALDVARGLREAAVAAEPRRFSRREVIAASIATTAVGWSAWRSLVSSGKPDSPRRTSTKEVTQPPGNWFTIEPLVWPLDELEFGWQVIQGGHGLRGETRDSALLSLGTWTAEEGSFSLELRQLNWTGGVGVYFGHVESTEQGRRFCRFQALFLVKQPDNKLQFQRQINRYWLSQPANWRVHTRTHGIVESHKGFDLPMRLELQFARNSLAAFIVDGNKIESLMDERQTDPSNAWPSCQGNFGILFRHGAGTFSNFKLNGEPQLLRTLASSNTEAR